MGRPQKTVLVVDDMEDWRVLIRFRLRAEGLAVIAEATDASEGVSLAGDRQPDAIVLDVHMPNLSGIGALARIRAAAPDATVVVVSGFGEGAWREQAIELGAAAYFDKAALNDLVSFLRGENGAGGNPTEAASPQPGETVRPGGGPKHQRYRDSTSKPMRR